MKRRWKALLLPLPFLLLLSATADPGEAREPDAVTDNETVFAELSASGDVNRVILVDWIRVFGDGRLRVDDAVAGRDFRPLAGTPRPRREGDRVVWELDVDGVADLFVTATPQQELPVELELRYFLDDQEVSPDQAQGANGKVKVEGTVRNRTDPFVPLLVNVSLALPIASFQRLDQGEASAVGVGRTIRLSYVLVPRPEQTFHYEINTERARLPALQVTALPQAIEEPELMDALDNLRETIEDLRTGVFDQLGGGAAGLASGASLGSAAASQLAAPGLVEQQIRRKVQQKHPVAAELARAIGTQERPGDARVLAHVLGGPDRAAGRALGAEVRERLPSLPEPGEVLSGLSSQLVPQGPLRQLAAGLAQVEASARQLQAALGRIDQEGFQDLVTELERAGSQLGTPEEAERARAYDTFTGKPEGADGEVRFVFRVAAPERDAEPPAATPDPDDRSFWQRLRSLLPWVD